MEIRVILTDDQILDLLSNRKSRIARTINYIKSNYNVVRCSCGEVFVDRFNYEIGLSVTAESLLKIHQSLAKKGEHNAV